MKDESVNAAIVNGKQMSEVSGSEVVPRARKVRLVGLSILGSSVLILGAGFATLSAFVSVGFPRQDYIPPHIAFSPSGTRVATNIEGEIDIRDSISGKRLLEREDIPYGGEFSLAWDSRGKLLALGGYHGAEILNVETGMTEALQGSDTDSRTTFSAIEVAWSDSGQLGVIYRDYQDRHGERTLQIWDTESD